MDVDTKPTKSMKKPARVQKRNQKPRNSIVFKKRVSSGKGTSYRGSSKKWEVFAEGHWIDVR
jgi:hypothetical protein